MRSAQSIARQRLDEKLRGIPEGLVAKPSQGWIAAIRDALGMSVRDLGRRMGTSGQLASRLEHDELSGVIQLSSLERAAAAMNCRLIYALIPNEPLEQMVRRQARQKAARAVGLVSHSMRIEDQAVAAGVELEQIDDLASEFVDRRGLWADTEP
jgi:predicted DNA-binding mobile mystery protein A